MSRKLTTEEFIKRAREVHGDKYDYFKVKYVNSQTKIEIICPEHGKFYQTPNNHLKGKGCPKCNGGIFLGCDDFVQKAKKVHRDRYDYSRVEYINSKTKVCIICPEHGEFWQTPDKHLQGDGCPECAGNKLLTCENFVKKAILIHSDKYDYSFVDYVNYKTKVKIVCPEHGPFWQKPANHLQGCGCPECGKKVSITDKRCSKCGTKLSKELFEDIPNANEFVSNLNNNTQKIKDRKYHNIEFALAIITVVLTVVSIYNNSPFLH